MIVEVSGTIDLRRKIDVEDYQKIRFLSHINYTIREIATEYGISTKYVKKILNKQVGTIPDVELMDVRHISCSGCGRLFDYSGIGDHYSIWTSGLNPLSCGLTIPGNN